MKKTIETKEREFVTLKVEKILFEPGQDWSSTDLELDSGLYLGEYQDGCLCFFVVDAYNNRTAIPIDAKLSAGVTAAMATQKAVLTFEEYMKEYELKFGRIESLVNNNNIILNELEDAAKENAETIAQSLVNIEKQIKELPKQTESQKSSLTEMGEVVVNIIKATK